MNPGKESKLFTFALTRVVGVAEVPYEATKNGFVFIAEKTLVVDVLCEEPILTENWPNGIIEYFSDDIVADAPEDNVKLVLVETDEIVPIRVLTLL